MTFFPLMSYPMCGMSSYQWSGMFPTRLGA